MEAALGPQADRAPQALPRRRPTRPQMEAALADLVPRRGAEILDHARRFSASREDAEDAYQRGLEIALTKAPATADDELVPWLKTVVKHEAFALAGAAKRAGPAAEETLQRIGSAGPGPDAQAEHYEQLRIGAEAISQLKPHEIRAMLLRAEGHSYAEIQATTGWSYTKVDRCLKEGRKSFVAHVHGIETGAACAAVEPVLSRLADGEASAAELIRVRRHLSRCRGCRETLARFSGAPRRVAALAGPVAALAAEPPARGAGALQRIHEQLVHWVHDKAALVGVKLQGATEAAGATKLAAVAASSVAIAGGGVVAVDRVAQLEADDRREVAAALERAARLGDRDPSVEPVVSVPARSATAAGPEQGRAGRPGGPERDERPERHDRPEDNGHEPVADGRDEPAPEPPAAEEFAPSPAPAPEPARAGGGSDPAAGRDRSGSGSGAGEFGM